ncbi:hypothetical protein QTN47_15240 [Danxiaibacter flavus]|uniref:Peptidase S74 domain-containing protein n=1 Tax=Danxiaibacter flavus TaxID=3049108 RepID=A0ABV3ZIG7_9BACT|nr:hypothetical protein QNM32_15250 [Chitinophagaceae bacterium DXS]
MKKILVAVIMTLICISVQAESGSFQVKGDIDKYYPVTFLDGNCWQNVATELEIGRAAVHTDASWRGALISKFRYHTYNWGNAANFIDADIRSCLLANAVIDRFVAGWTDATYLNGDAKIIIWLRGGTTTYYYKANANVNPVVYDGVQNPLPFQQTNGPTHTYKTIVDYYVNTKGATLGNDLSVNGNTSTIGNINAGTTAQRNYIKISSREWPEIRFQTPGDDEVIRLGVAHLDGSNYPVKNGDFYVYSSLTNSMGLVVAKNGNVNIAPAVGKVGIGTTSPTEKLSVNGTVLAKKVRVSQAAADWPDYVFDSSYELPSLVSVSSFVKENKHLPEMPSALTIEKDGHDLGEVQKLLLKKVEELTLYVIELEKKLALLEKK